MHSQVVCCRSIICACLIRSLLSELVHLQKLHIAIVWIVNYWCKCGTSQKSSIHDLQLFDTKRQMSHTSLPFPGLME